MTNYIQRLKAEKEAAEREVAALQEGFRDLRRYLQSSKFHDDTTVQASDVLVRLSAIMDQGTSARHDGGVVA